MCSPRVMAKVERSRISRRGFLGMIGATAALGTTTVAARPARAQAAVSLAGGDFMVRDLTHTISPDFPVFPGDAPMEIEDVNTIEEDGFALKRLSFGEHTGTHMDAPAHFDPGGVTADRYPVENFFAPLAVIDLSERAASDDDAAVTVDDVVAWEASYGPLPPGAFVAMYSGWEERLSDPGSFVNADDSDTPHFPGFGPEAATFLVNERDVVGIGVDTLSLDIGTSEDFEVHTSVLSAGKYGLETLANLGEIPPSGATIVVGGPKHEGATGGPSRVFALSPSAASGLPYTGGPRPPGTRGPM